MPIELVSHSAHTTVQQYTKLALVNGELHMNMNFDFEGSDYDPVREEYTSGLSKPPNGRNPKIHPGQMEYIRRYVRNKPSDSILSVRIEFFKDNDGNVISIPWTKWSDGVWCGKKQLLQLSLYDFCNPANKKGYPYFSTPQAGAFKRLPLTTLEGTRQIQIHHPELKNKNVILSIDELTSHLAWDCMSKGRIKPYVRTRQAYSKRILVNLLKPKENRLDTDNKYVKELLEFLSKVDFIERGEQGKFTLFFSSGDNHYVGKLGGISSKDDNVVNCLMKELVNVFVSSRDDILFRMDHKSGQLLLDYIKYDTSISISRFENLSQIKNPEAYDY